MTLLADEQFDMPIGVAFVDATGEPGWILLTLESCALLLCI